jgi:hypothetical protein
MATRPSGKSRERKPGKAGGVVSEATPGAKPRERDKAGRGRPRRPARQRKQLIVDVATLEAAMAASGENQSETVNLALAAYAENAAINAGFDAMTGAYPDWPDHTPSGRRWPLEVEAEE